MRIAIATLATLLLAACQPAREEGAADGSTAPEAAAPAAEASEPAATKDVGTGAAQAFAAIGPEETIRLIGTEPFWGGTVRGGELVYTTPENQAGETIAVRRFAGNNGLGFSGQRGGAALDLTVTPGACSDGMSDRSYPFTATLRIGEEQRSGCAWTERQPFTGPAAP